jgi:hypothetical protein
MSGTQKNKLVWAALTLGIIASVLAGSALWGQRQTLVKTQEALRLSGGAAPNATPGWLSGATEEKLAQIERHLRGLDVAMAEIGYRYGELQFARRGRNWGYAKYQAEKIDLALRLALERRPKRAQSSHPFLNDSLPAVLRAIESKEPEQFDQAMERLHNACVECHKAENVLYFRGAVQRLRDSAR